MSSPHAFPEIDDHGLLRFLTCGSVDDGKSTLIGRLLHDTRAILADTLETLAATSRRRGLDGVDLSLLTDGLAAEREQGITIDVAYRYFTTGTRKYIIADAPGHEQYTRNMVTAASNADLAIILIDARRGVQTQTRRHAYLAHLLGIPNLVVAVNKMDLVDHDAEVFARIRRDFLDFAAWLGIEGACFVPISALHGDNVVERGPHLDWYRGPTLVELLECAPSAQGTRPDVFRCPVQYVCRPRDSADPALHDYRGYMGRVESGAIAVGDAVMALPSGRTSRVRDIQIGGVGQPEAGPEQSVTLLLEDALDISRGDLLVRPDQAPAPRRELEAHLCWLAERPLSASRHYLLRHTTREVRARVAAIEHRIDLNALTHQPATELGMNDIARLRLRLAQPIHPDPYASNRATGAFVLIDESTNDTVGAGMIL
ncbi:sulfate adenylyltransferase subunit 1 [Marichromatium gracile]|uniref:sulfate adenylyltransferase n=1 Tax=Marichromatium gracile TaxID=1048 RepID=A0A4V2W9F7_MARGR|nr:GTP-binding protein [Marichromatium gracile]MBK1708053.1 sulfate adenylyltransferase [Marichromatium gracile]TCW35180.1 sulfate adenylyltransferase subunit 1 [Marichromatium gracile]